MGDEREEARSQRSDDERHEMGDERPQKDTSIVFGMRLLAGISESWNSIILQR